MQIYNGSATNGHQAPPAVAVDEFIKEGVAHLEVEENHRYVENAIEKPESIQDLRPDDNPEIGNSNGSQNWYDNHVRQHSKTSEKASGYMKDFQLPI